MVDTKLEKENKKMRENMMKQHDETKGSTLLMQAANFKMAQSVGKMDDLLLSWKSKMTSYDSKI